MKRLLILLIFVFSMGAFAAETKVKHLKSKGSKHIIMTSSNLGYQKNGTLTISDGEAKTVDFKILKVNKEGNKLLIQGPENVSVEDLCSFSCVGTTAGGSLEDEFASEFSDRSPASTPNESKGNLNDAVKNGLWGFSFAASNNYTCEGEICDDDEKSKSIDTGLELFGESLVFKKSVGPILAGIGVGGGLMYMSRDLEITEANAGDSYVKGMEDWSLDAIQPSVHVNFHIIPLDLIRIFIGAKLNYSILLSNEASDSRTIDGFGTITAKSEVEYAGGLSFGFQTGVNLVLDPFMVQLRYQAYTIDAETTQTTTINGTKFDQLSGTSTADLAISQLMLSVGMTF